MTVHGRWRGLLCSLPGHRGALCGMNVREGTGESDWVCVFERDEIT